MTNMNRWTKAIAGLLLFSAMAIASSAQVTFTSLGSFDGTNGYDPSGPLVQATNGKIYGTVIYGGGGVDNPCADQDGCGGIFSLAPGGKLTLDYNFCVGNPNCTLGNFPSYGLLLAGNGEFYGITGSGGTEQLGTIYKFSPSGGVTTVYNFCALQGGGNCVNGFGPQGGLIQGANLNFYGTTIHGGAASGPAGTLFEATPGGDLTTLYSFCADNACPGGAKPYAAPIQASNGNFYGTSFSGGANNETNCPKSDVSTGCGAVYQATPAGKVTTLYNFCSDPNCTDGNNPYAGLVQGNNGNLYGTTMWGGDGGTQNVCYGACGTVFEITPAGKLTTLYNFCSQPSCADGSGPYSSLILGSDGNLYGTTFNGGTGANCTTLNGCGTIFKITPAGKLTTLHSFDLTDGYFPTALFQATDGDFYGTSAQGGGDSQDCYFGCGAAFKLSVGLLPFARTIPSSSRTGASVIILGDSLTGATAVSFNGTSATFTVVSATEIKATVPAGATSGWVTVTTPINVLQSNTKFQIIE